MGSYSMVMHTCVSPSNFPGMKTKKRILAYLKENTRLSKGIPKKENGILQFFMFQIDQEY